MKQRQFQRFRFAAALLCAVVVGCGGPGEIGIVVAAPSARDRPAPAGEPRAELALTVSLPPSRDCEERFDVALYAERDVELVAWDAQTDACSGRRVTIRYLSTRLTREALLERVRRLASETAEQPAAAGDDR